MSISSSPPSRGETSPVRPDGMLRIATGAALAAMTMMALGPSIVKRSHVQGLEFAVWRLWVASAVYYALTLARGRPLRREDLRRALPAGLLFGLNIATFFTSIKLTSAANNTLISALQPAVTLAVVGPLFGEKPKRIVWLWTAVAIGGVALAVRAGASAKTGDPTGDAWAFVSMILFTAYYLASNRMRSTLDAIAGVAALTFIAACLVTPITLVVEGVPPWPGHDWVWIGLMVALPGTGHLLTTFAHGYVPVTTMSLVALLSPVASAGWAWWLLDENLVALQLVGMAIVLGSLAVVVTTGRTPTRKPTPRPPRRR